MPPATRAHRALTTSPLALATGQMTYAQRQAVFADEPVVCVLAGAGTGKTRVLTARVARRCAETGATPERTLVCTFSRQAARQLRERLSGFGVTGVRAGTIHHVALQILSDWHARAGQAPPALLGDRIHMLAGLLPAQAATPGTLRQLDTEIGWSKAHMTKDQDYPSLVDQHRRVVRLPIALVSEVFTRYEAERQRRGVIDFDDLLVESAGVLATHDDYAQAMRWRFRHLYVDELQDVNAAQFRLLALLGGEEPDLFCVGDPHQSIYGWNGADPDLLRQLPTIYPTARVIKLEENHRCTPAIVRCAAAALGVTPPAATKPEGHVPQVLEHGTDGDETEWVTRQIWLGRQPGRRWSAMAVLARTNAQLRPIAESLARQKIPFTLASSALGPASDLGKDDDGGALESDRGGPSTEEATDGVILSTFHRAKGLEWPCVFVVGLSEGWVPLASARSVASLDEERRLLYVAMTRAQEELWCSWARSKDAITPSSSRSRSRWLDAVEQERSILEKELAPVSPEAAAAHVAELRSLLSRADPPSQGRLRLIASDQPGPP